MMKKILLVLLILCLCIAPIVSAQNETKKEPTILPTPDITPIETPSPYIELKEGTTKGSVSDVYLFDGDVRFKETETGSTISTSLVLDNKKFAPTKTTLTKENLKWNDDDIEVAYQYESYKLKETITLKKDTDIKIPVYLSPGYFLNQLSNGEIIIDNPDLPTTASKIKIQKPFGVDKTDRYIPMDYSINGNELSLVYNRNGIVYPLTIDPTFVLMTGFYRGYDPSGYMIDIYNLTGVYTWTSDNNATSVEYLVIGGGSAGGGNAGSGGGGAGGFLNGTMTITPSTTYNVVVGLGGVGIGGADGQNGQNSSFANTTSGNGKNSMGGGGGAGAGVGANGASGGGGRIGALAGGTNVTGQGFGGGTGGPGIADARGGGGGGCGQQGLTGAVLVGGNGGRGLANSINGSVGFYCGGGGAGALVAATGAIGGIGGGGAGNAGGAGGGYPAINGTGGGGGGSGNNGIAGGMGGSGVVILRYPAASPPSTTNPNSTIKFIPNTAYISNLTNSTVTIPIFVQNLTYVKNIYVNVSWNPLWLNATKWTTNTTDFTDSPVTDNWISYNNYSGFIYANISKWHFNTTGTTPKSIGSIDFYLKNQSTPNGKVLPFIFNITAATDGDGSSYIGTGFNTTVASNISDYFTYRETGSLTAITQYILNLTYKNAETLSVLTDAEIMASWSTPGTGDFYSGSNTTHVGLMNLYAPAGEITVTSTAPGYKSSVNIFTIPTDGPNIIYLVPEAVTQLVSPMYAKEISFAVVNIYNVPIQNASFVATPVNSSFSGTNWLTTLFGIPGEATSLNATVVYGMTDSAGAITLPMVSSQFYQINIDQATLGVHETRWLYPTEPSYTIIVASTATSLLHTLLTDCVNATLYSIDAAPNVWINLSYNDTCLQTANTTFYVNYPNMTRAYTQTFNGTECYCLPATNQTFTTGWLVPNVAGSSYVWGYTANNTAFGNLSKAQGITLKGPTGILINYFNPGCTGWSC